MAGIKEILTKVKSLNGAQRRLGNYLQNDSSALLLSNVNDLAQAVGVSKATVVRFAKTLGYAGFPELKRDLQKEMRRKLRAADRMKETFAELGDDGVEDALAGPHRVLVAADLDGGRLVLPLSRGLAPTAASALLPGFSALGLEASGRDEPGIHFVQPGAARRTQAR